MYSQKIDITPHLKTKIGVFIADPLMRKHTEVTLKHMGFTNVTAADVPPNYFEALNRIVPMIAGDAELVLMNLPNRPQPASAKDDMVTIYDVIADNYDDIKTQLTKRKVDTGKKLSKAIPLIEVGDYLREKIIEVLVKYRVPSAFFMTAPMIIKKSETAARKEWKAKKNLELFYTELSSYLNYYFRDKDELVTLIDDKLTEQELTERKNKYDELSKQAEAAKEKGDIDTAINLLRQAIDLFPQDIEAFLESGRLYVRKREYGRALIRYGQAEDLFDEAPEPNKEIGNLRLTQVKEKIKNGISPESPEVLELLEDAVSNFKTAMGKAEELEKSYAGDKDIVQHDTVTSIAADILKWNVAPMLGPKHPMVVKLLGVVQDSTHKLNELALDQMNGPQCMAMALHARQKKEFNSAEMYYFQALKDNSTYVDACTEINKLGMALRKMGQIDVAMEIYEKLLKHDPPNMGSVYMNMAIACASKNAAMDSAGYTMRCLYTDPELAREEQFYGSIIPQMVPILTRLLKVVYYIVDNVKKVKPPEQLIKMMEVRQRLLLLIRENKKKEALQLFLNVYTRAPKFTVNPEFYADGIIPTFLQEIRPSLASNEDGGKKQLEIVTAWLRHISKNPAPKKLVQFHKLLNGAQANVNQVSENHEASFFIGKALILLPETYYNSPYFYTRKDMVALVRELKFKLRYLNPDFFPKRIVDPKTGQTKVVVKKMS